MVDFKDYIREGGERVNQVFVYYSLNKCNLKTNKLFTRERRRCDVVMTTRCILRVSYLHGAEP